MAAAIRAPLGAAAGPRPGGSRHRRPPPGRRPGRAAITPGRVAPAHATGPGRPAPPHDGPHPLLEFAARRKSLAPARGWREPPTGRWPAPTWPLIDSPRQPPGRGRIMMCLLCGPGVDPDSEASWCGPEQDRWKPQPSGAAAWAGSSCRRRHVAICRRPSPGGRWGDAALHGRGRGSEVSL